MYQRGNLKGLIFICAFRVTHFIVIQHLLIKIIFCPIWISYRLIFNYVLGIDISEYATIGKRFQLWHGIGTIIHPQAIIGNDVIMHHNTTIGEAVPGGKVPVIGNHVNIGAHAVIIGNIHIGDNVTIGAGSVITKNIPSSVVVVGNPARIIKSTEQR